MAAVAVRRKPASWCNAWCLVASVMLSSCVSGSSSSARSRGAYVTTLSAYSRITKSGVLRLPSERSHVQAVARQRPSRRRNIETTAVGATAAHMTAAAEGEEKELRLLTWIEVEARIEREIAEVRRYFCILSSILLPGIKFSPIAADVVWLTHLHSRVLLLHCCCCTVPGSSIYNLYV